MTDNSGVAINWRNIGVKRERNHEALISRLTLENRSVFQYLKDLMVFAAMVGYSHDERREISGETIEIILDTYASDEKDGFIYLLGLLEHKDGQVLKDEKLKECVVVFEEYCNAGLYIIEDWLNENPGDPSGVDTLLDKIYQRLSENEKLKDINNDEIEIDID
ncbi:DNA phosphorothioation-associated protein 4 [Halomonas alimentaria]|uniref:DNA phosphorothioation-associated protein 4 n=1 Tax=Halomonas alimentaria TaxID=147248 RepID=A0A7X5APL2_9GAMM|nr:DNA phosphorothioation-associated protein 4 [Halomonas alimentaria]NAW33497.1 DNA phosphorothioation-associated protein 4 [Halomonas alimentaria]